MNTLTFWDYLALSTDELVARGVPKRAVVDRRFAATGHTRPIGARWLRSFGGWGGVLDLDELADRVGVERQVVKDYAKAKGLRWATRERRRTHAQLAIQLWCDRHRPPDESSLRFGIYPGERRILCAAAQVLIDTTEGGIANLLRWPLRDLEARFAELRVDVSPPSTLLGVAVLRDVSGRAA